MTARRAGRGSLRRASLSLCALLSTLAIAPRALLAQDDPAPFWMPAAPAKESPDQAAPAKKKKPAKSAAPVKTKPAAPAKAKTTQPPKTKKPSRPDANRNAQDAVDDSIGDETPAAPAKKKHHYEPLPPLPHLEPGPPPTTERPYYQPPLQPAPNYPPAPVSPSAPAPRRAPPAYPPTIPAYPPSYPPPPPQPRPQPPPAQPYWNPRAQPTAQVPAAPTAVPIDEQREGQAQASDDSDSPPPFRRFSGELLFGLWGKANSDGQGHSWQVAYGVDLGVGIFRWLQLDVRGLRSAGTDGNAYVNATTSHILVDGRLSGVLTLGKFAGFFGGGGGLVIEQTQLFLQDVGGDPGTLSSSGLQPIGEVFAGVRARPWRGLTVHLEFDGILRQGNLEPVLLLGAGWAL